MHTSAAAKETFFAPELPRTGQIVNFIEAHAEKRGFTPEPKFFLSGGEMGDQVEIPHEVYEVLVKAVHAMSNGLAVTITPSSHSITTQQAAELLGITRPTLVKMLDDGKIPFEKPGTHRRVRLADVLDYKEKRKVEQYSALRALGPADDSSPERSIDDMRKARKEAAKLRRSIK